MATTLSKDSSPNPSWLTPKRLLFMFCVINMINYVDRGVIASNGVNGSLKTCDDKGICTSSSEIQGDFNSKNFQDGVLSAAFMVGLLVASPILLPWQRDECGRSQKSLSKSIWVDEEVTLSIKEPSAGVLGHYWEGPYRVARVI